MRPSIIFGVCWLALMIIVHSAVSFNEVEILGIVVTKSSILFGMLFFYLLIIISMSQ